MIFQSIPRLLSNGLIPTHLDTHMGAVRATPKTLQAYLEVGNKFQLPVQISEDYKSILDNKLIDFDLVDLNILNDKNY